MSAGLRYNRPKRCGMAELKYTFTNDTLFKILFVKHPNLLKKLIAAMLRIRFDSIGKFDIRNPEMPPETLGEKFCRLDINMEVDGQRVDLEVQVKNEGDYAARTLYHWAREYSSALPESGRYADLPRTVIISIVAFNLFDCLEYFSEYQALEVTRFTPLSDRMALMYFELPKLPQEVAADNYLELWLSLFKAKTEEDLAKLETLEVPDMKEAISAYRHITVTPEFQEAERLRAKARHDEAQALYNAEIKGVQKGIQQGIQRGIQKGTINVAKALLLDGDSIDRIVHITGLSREEVERLRS